MLEVCRRDDRRGFLSSSFGWIIIASAPAVDGEAIAHGATEEAVHGHAERTPGDVPQRLIDASDGAPDNGTSAVPVKLLPR
jgi:hypothetical protein